MRSYLYAICAITIGGILALCGLLLPPTSMSAAARVKSDFAALHAKQKMDRYHWYELTDVQVAALDKALKDYHPSKPIMILSATADSLSLAEDFDLAFNKAGIKSTIDRPMDVQTGLHVTDPRLANLITAATHIKCIVDKDETGPDGSYVLNFGRKQ